MKTSIEEITPETAAKYLTSSKGNRSISPRRVERYSNDMKKGKWVLTHQGVAFNRSGDLIDGHHRMHAIIKTGLTIHLQVTRGVDDGNFSALDMGGNRTGSDLLTISGMAPRISRIVSAAVPYCVNYGLGNTMLRDATRFGALNLLVLDFVKKNPSLITSAEFITKMPRRDALVKESISCFLHFQISKQYHDADDFISKVLTGDMVQPNTILHELRKVLIANKIGNYRITESALINKMIGAYCHYHAGTNLKDPAQALGRFKNDSNVRIK